MIKYLKYYWLQRKNEQALAEIFSTYEEEVAKAREKGASPNELHELGADAHFENKQIKEDILREASKYYLRLAHRMLIPIPDYSEHSSEWIESEQMPGHYHLSVEALHNVRRLVRIELKESREGWFIWVAALTGLVGAVTGLLAVWKS